MLRISGYVTLFYFAICFSLEMISKVLSSLILCILIRSELN